MTDSEYASALAAARDALGAVSQDDPAHAVEALSAVRVQVERALDEAMAQATLAGESVRRVAERAGLAPNTVAARLARSSVLGGYAAPAAVPRVGAEELARARFDRRTSADPSSTPASEPLRFRRRRPTHEEER